MLKITADIFSGRPNPVWHVDEDQARELLTHLADNPGALLSAQEDMPGRLGYRGMLIEMESEHLASFYALPHSLRLGGDVSAAKGRGGELAERIVATIPEGGPLAADGSEQDYRDLPAYLLEQIAAAGERFKELSSGAPGSLKAFDSDDDSDDDESSEDLSASSCIVERTTFNPGFWNAQPHLPRNNCYNYATNRRTDTFAQPGRAAGRPIGSLACADVAAAALADGARRHGDCLPDSEKPRWLVALVVAPGRDYHWYRASAEGFWGHKPGQTAATNLDNSGKVISNPERCNRGPYTQFCGYFYSGKSHKVR